MTPDISVLIATYNRSGELRRTLQRALAHRPSAPSVELVVVDNNSGDDTREVIEGFAREHPVRYLFEARPGKNCALNAALAQVELGSIVLFTDDDIDVAPDYFSEVARACRELPEHAVFGGPQEAVWPPGVPGWATDPSILGWGFPVIDLGPDRKPFPPGRFPVGGNFWVRREVLESGIRYDERFGPRPRNRIMGSEASFLRSLHDLGYPSYYVPTARTGHRMLPAEVTPKAIRRRAYRAGRTGPHIGGLKDGQTLARNRRLWRARRQASLLRYALLTGLGFLHPSADRRTVVTVRNIRGLAYNLEALRLEKQRHAAGAGQGPPL